MKNVIVVILSFLLCGCVDNNIRKNDDTGPYINLSQYEFTTQVGKEIDFSNITAYDDVDGLIPVIVRGNVNYNKPGEYYLTLTAVDYSNNQTDVGIVVYVTEEEYIQEENLPVIKEEEISCPNGKDPSLGCDIVLHEDIKDYEMLFSGEEGKEHCENKVVEDKTTCEVIYTNDQSFWGYGLRKK